jgi:hypothetical protein
MRCTSTKLAQVFLFLYVGLLLNTDPDGIAGNRIMFSVFVGLLTTSIGTTTLLIVLLPPASPAAAATPHRPPLQLTN